MELQTDARENITFPQLRLREVNIWAFSLLLPAAYMGIPWLDRQLLRSHQLKYMNFKHINYFPKLTTFCSIHLISPVLHVSVCSQRVVPYPPNTPPPLGTRHPLGTRQPLPPGNHKSRRYASYWNAFLFSMLTWVLCSILLEVLTLTLSRVCHAMNQVILRRHDVNSVLTILRLWAFLTGSLRVAL